jgi:hypothetical protein
MNDQARSVNIELKLGREEYRGLIDRLREEPVSLHIKRGRITAELTWMELEIRGLEPDVDHALQLSRAARTT